MKSVDKVAEKMPPNKSVATRCFSVLSLFFILLFILECRGFDTREANRQRLEAQNSMHYSNAVSYNHEYGAPSTYEYVHPQRPNKYRTNHHRRSYDINDSRSPYSHGSPAIISVPESRTIYKSMVDPSTIYKNRESLNVTERERKQLLHMKSAKGGYPRMGFAKPKYDDPIRLRNVPPYHINREGRTADPATTTENYDHRRERIWESLIDRNMKTNVQYSHSAPSLTHSEPSICVNCPSERTAVAARGKERALVLPPSLTDCRGRSVPPEVTFTALYGPKIGSPVREGSHVILGNIIKGNETLKMCQYRYNVIVRRCPQQQLEHGVTATCQRKRAWGSSCRFTCASPSHALHGPVRATCGNDLRWSNEPPTCQEPEGNWCETRPIIQYSRLSCDAPLGEAPPGALPERTACNVWCRGGTDQRRSRLAVPDRQLVCQRGLWRGDNSPCPKPRRQKNQRKHARRQARQNSNNSTTVRPHLN